MTPAQHHFLCFKAPKKKRALARELAVALLNFYTGRQHSKSKWKKLGRTISAKRGGKTIQFSYDDFETALDASSGLDPAAFCLEEPDSTWLDKGISAVPHFHAVGSDGNALTFRLPTNLGDSFPLVPTIDREGAAFSTAQKSTLTRIADLRETLVESSTGENISGSTWLQDLRALVFESMSLVDMTLHQLYYKAKYGPKPGWAFDEARLEKKARLAGGRLADKLGWVYEITRNTLNWSTEKPEFTRLRELRNHLTHWDPPVFCFSMEDCERWLNAVHSVAMLNYKIRQCATEPPCSPLVRLLLQPEVAFSPPDPSRPRLPQTSSTGYGSTRWDQAHAPKAVQQTDEG